MTNWLYQIRVLLAAVPAVLCIVYIEPESYVSYTASILLVLLLIKGGSYLPRLANLFLPIELIANSWLSYTYDGFLFLLIFSTLIAAFQRVPAPISGLGWTLVSLLALYIGLNGHDSELIITALVLLTVMAAILHAANEFQNKSHKIEDLYEALALSHQQLDATKRRMQIYASQVEQYAQVEERNRIAKDIHDDLGHRLIRVKMMSEASLHLFEADTLRARGMVEQIRDQLQDSMEIMRRTVRKLAAENVGEARRYALNRLVEESGEALGIEVSFHVHGAPRPLYPSMELILFKNAQEAITNAVRHGSATSVNVDLDFQSASVSLTITSNGSLPRVPIEAGLGLRGMKERIALIGGLLEWQQDEQFSISTILPLPGD